MNLHIVQFQYGREFLGLSRILILYNPSKMSSDGIFVIDNRIPSHFESISWIPSFWRKILNKSA